MWGAASLSGARKDASRCSSSLTAPPDELRAGWFALAVPIRPRVLPHPRRDLRALGGSISVNQYQAGQKRVV